MSKLERSTWNCAWVNGESVTLAEIVPVWNPASGEQVGEVPQGGEVLTRKAVDAAWEAFPGWSKRTGPERARYLNAWAERIDADREVLGELMSAEQGKPVQEAIGEIDVCTDFIRWYAEEGKRVYGEVLPVSRPDMRLTVMKQPVGVAALITPWNFPAAMVARKVAPALAAGCTVILKPARQTPLIAIALFHHLMETGLPRGVANLVTGSAAVIGQALLDDLRVRKLSFTGSTEVGKQLLRESADHVKRVSLELGGNAPAIVFPDADLEHAAEAIVSNKFENCGQVCNGINLIYVHEDVRTAMTEKLAQRVQQLVVGPGHTPDVQVGPLIDEVAVQRMETLVQDATEKGATVLVGGHRLKGGVFQRGTFYAPTVLDGVDSRMQMTQEEVFGPVAPVLTFRDENELLERCNSTPYGLAAYLFTRDVGRVSRISEALEFGMVGVNNTSLSFPQAPFGGIKQSGIGREGGHHGLAEFLNLKYVALNVQ